MSFIYFPNNKKYLSNFYDLQLKKNYPAKYFITHEEDYFYLQTEDKTICYTTKLCLLQNNTKAKYIKVKFKIKNNILYSNYEDCYLQVFFNKQVAKIELHEKINSFVFFNNDIRSIYLNHKKYYIDTEDKFELNLKNTLRDFCEFHDLPYNDNGWYFDKQNICITGIAIHQRFLNYSKTFKYFDDDNYINIYYVVSFCSHITDVYNLDMDC